MNHYVIVLSPGPLIMVRVPTERLKTRRGYRSRIRGAPLHRALTGLMREHGLRQKDILVLEHHAHPDDCDPVTYERAELAFDGSSDWLKPFRLYDWNDGAFVLVRGSIETTESGKAPASPSVEPPRDP